MTYAIVGKYWKVSKKIPGSMIIKKLCGTFWYYLLSFLRSKKRTEINGVNVIQLIIKIFWSLQISMAESYDNKYINFDKNCVIFYLALFFYIPFFFLMHLYLEVNILTLWLKIFSLLFTYLKKLFSTKTWHKITYEINIVGVTTKRENFVFVIQSKKISSIRTIEANQNSSDISEILQLKSWRVVVTMTSLLQSDKTMCLCVWRNILFSLKSF